MNRNLLGEQLHGHLQLYKGLGVRYLESVERKARPKAAVLKVAEIAEIAKVAEVANGFTIASAAGVAVSPESSKSSSPSARPVPAIVPDAAIGSGTREALEAILSDIGDCKRCKLAPTRTNLVFGSGNPHAALMFVGEAPGADEDAQGLPFVGRAGRLLTLVIESIGIRREDVFICNILKCRPPGNRNPETDEIAACEGFLFRQIEAVQPKVIVALGAFGAQTLLRSTDAIGKLRGRLTNYRGVKLMATYHPAYLLRNPLEKRKVWEDMQIVRDYLRKM